MKALPIGTRFGELVTISDVWSGGAGVGRLVKVRCDCGNESTVRCSNLKVQPSRSPTTTCGDRDRHPRSGRHFRSGTPEYIAWQAMIQRCTNPNSPHWIDYGGRGIEVCDEWRDFDRFFADMGERPDERVLDRIDNDGDYEADNCRWATISESMINRRRSRPPIGQGHGKHARRTPIE